MTPRSTMGRVAAMFYSLFGIPLAFTWLIVIGRSLATIWLSFFHNICCYLCREKTIDNQSKLPSKTNQSKPQILPKLRSNSVEPFEKQKLLSKSKLQSRNSGKCRQTLFPEALHDELSGNGHLVNKEINFRKKILRDVEFTEIEEMYYTIDYAVAIIYSFLFFIIYCIFSSILFSVYEKWLLTDVLYISFLMFLTLGPGCHELDDDGIEIKMKNNIVYLIHLCIGYCILGMIAYLIYRMMMRNKCKSEKLQNQVVFDSCFREKF